MFIDTHTHLYTEEYADDRKEVIERAVTAGAKFILLPNIDAASIPQMEALCREYPGLCRPMMGLHPTELPEGDPTSLLDTMEKLIATRPGHYVAVGEVGLDFYWDRSRETDQIAAFERQIGWAEKYNLPLMIHSRSAHRELVNTLLPHADKVKAGVFHCYSGSKEEAEELLNRFPQFMLGIGGVVTFKKCKLPDTLKEVVPLSRIVLETDAPYLAPTPYRGKRNESAYIPLIIDYLAYIYNTSPKEVAQITTQNAIATFSL